MKNLTDQKKAYLFALIAVFFWSTVASAFKITLRYITSVQLLFLATLFSVMVLLLVLVCQGKVKLLFNLSGKDLLFSMFLGMINPFLYYLVLFKAYSLLPAQQAQPLNQIWGVVIVIMSAVILKQKLIPRDLIAIFISFLGVVVISTRADFSSFNLTNPAGVFLAVGSSVIWSWYWILNKRDKTEPLVRLFVNFVFGLIFIIGYIFVFSGFKSIPASGWIGGIYTGVFEMGLAFFFWVKAMKLTNSTAKISILIFIAPFISLFFIYYLVGEAIHYSSVFGLCLIIAGILIIYFKDFLLKK